MGREEHFWCGCRNSTSRLTSRSSASSCVVQVKPYTEHPLLDPYLGDVLERGYIHPVTGKSCGVNVNFVDGIAVLIHGKDELHLLSVVGLGAVKQGQSLPQKLAAILVLPWKLRSGRVIGLSSFAHIPQRVPNPASFSVLFWVADGLTMLSKGFLDSSNFYSSDSSWGIAETMG